MKQSLLALTIASIFAAGAANAATVLKADNGDFLKVYGGAEIGGTLISDTDKTPKGQDSTYVDDSFMTLGAKGQTQNIYFKFEMDAERQDWNEDNNFRLVIDKAYIGYKVTKNQSIEFGRTDTAYDHVDGFGDVTNELGAGISEAGDQDNTIKYQGQRGNVKVGISHSLEGWDGTLENNQPKKYSYETDSLYGKVTNGYIGYYDKEFTVIAGAESGDETEIYSLHSKVKFGDITIAGLIFDETKNFNKGSDTNVVGGNIGGKFKLTEKMTLLGSVNLEDTDFEDASKKDYKAEWLVIGGEYQYAKNVKLAAEIALGDVLKDGESGALGYLKAYYWF